jgi:hypothetical protein
MGKTSEFFVLREIASYVSTKSALVSAQQLNITAVAVGDLHHLGVVT